MNGSAPLTSRSGCARLAAETKKNGARPASWPGNAPVSEGSSRGNDTADSRKEPERGIYAHLCRFTVENTSDPGFAMRVKNSRLKRHKCRAPIVFLNQPWRL